MSDPLQDNSRPDGANGRRTSRVQTFGAVTGPVLLLAAVGYWAVRYEAPTEPVSLAVPTDRPESGPSNVNRPPAADPDERQRQLAVGTWRDFHHGKRTLTLRDDGTATMVLELSGLKARLFTRRLELKIVWSIEDGKMHRRTVGGTPRDKVEFVNRRAGVAVAEPIEELTADQMTLLDQNGSQKYHWRRVP
jgi:hypothetical protein